MKDICFHLNRKVWAVLAMTLLMAFPALAQKITVHGTVMDETGEPLIGATVMEKGTTNGTSADFDGHYELSVNPQATLVVSYVGYDPVDVPVNGRTEINVVMKENAEMLSEVMVIGYGSVKKADATGSVAVVKPDEIEAGLATSAQDLLVGASPGVVVTLDGGNPSGGANITIRGGASLSASNDPLIVVDGVPMNMNSVVGASNPLSMISPDNIESMTILKDASATAIYGSRASNGVIIITTKKGQSGRPQVNFSANFYVNTPRNYLNMMTGDQFRNYVNANYAADSDQVSALGAYNTNWQKEVLRTTFSSDYSLSVGGTLKWLPYRVAVSYTNNNGIIKHSKMDRVTLGVNLTPTFFDDLLSVQVNAKGSYVQNQYNASVLGTAVSMNPTLPVRDYQNGVEQLGYWTIYDGAGRPFTRDTWTGNGLDINTTTAPMNPIAQLMENESKGTSWQSIGNLQVDLKMPFLRELRANLNLGYDIAKGNWFGYDWAYSPMAWRNGYTINNKNNPDLPPGEGDPLQVRDGGTSATKQNQLNRNLLLDFYLNYNKEFTAIKSQFDITAGYSWQHFFVSRYDHGYVYEVGNPDMEKWVDYQMYPTSVNKHYNLQLLSFFGRINYILMDRYLITATVRWDGTSRFSKENRWGTFPSVALGWKILEESFMERARGWMTELKMRAGYGVTGQQDLGEGNIFPYLPTYSVGNTDLNHRYPFGDNTNTPYVSPDSYNTTIKWEETHTWNVGVDYGFLNNRIAGSIDFYKRMTKDLFTYANYPAGSNLSNKGNINIGDLENIGIEFNINTKPVVTDNVVWTSALNVAWNKNKITRLAEGADTQTGSLGGQNGNVQKHEVGHPAYSFYVYEQVYDKNGKPLENVFVDQNGDGQIDESDKILYHSRNPKVTLAWNNNVTYKNWDFGIVLRASLGNYMFNQNQMNNVFTTSLNALPLSNMLADETYFSDRNIHTMQSSYFVQNASFLRCDNITVGYTWPHLIDGNLRLRLYGAVQNPFVITKYKGLDPEVFSGIDNAVYPRPVTCTIGLVATF